VVLEQQRAEAEVARQEWDALNPDTPPPSGLVVREPQVRQAEAELAAAEADLQVARLNLERTAIAMPFDGVVVSESVDVGQYIVPGQPVARVYGTDAVEIRLPLEKRELAWFEVPSGASREGPRAEVETSYGGQTHTWTGRVTRMEAEVDPNSRMVSVVVEVRDPFDRSGERPPLLPGSFVDVKIFGRTVENLIPIPRYAIHEGGQVWIFENGVLRIREVTVARSDREHAFVSSGLDHGEKIVVSSLDAVTDGMKVRAADTVEPSVASMGDVQILGTGFWILDPPPTQHNTQLAASAIQHPASSIQHPASSIQHPASSIQHPASSIVWLGGGAA
jgi:RND family efflux transporter MFP subunit